MRIFNTFTFSVFLLEGYKAGCNDLVDMTCNFCAKNAEVEIIFFNIFLN